MDLGSFRTIRQLADGGLGPTYLAADKRSSQQLVVKAIAPKFLRQPETPSRLSALAAAQAVPGADGIVKLLGCTMHTDGSALLAMPFVDGANIGELVARRPGEPAQHSLRIVREVATMLAAAHQAGRRHLALRPSQVLVRTASDSAHGITVHLLGLGLVEALGSKRPLAGNGRVQVYVAPEQQESAAAAAINERTDVYGLGVLLVHLLLGQQPTPEALQQYRYDAAKLFAGRAASADLVRLIQGMLATELKGRLPLAEVLWILDRELENESRKANPVPLGMSLADEPDKSEADHTVVSHRAAGTLFGNFRIIRTLGEGGMGIVYEVEHQQIGSRAAIKVLHPKYAQNDEYIKRFLNEARAVNIIRHPGLVEIFEFGQESGSLYIVMEFLQGESLLARLKKGKDSYSIAHILSWATQMARALAATHAKGIMHRDLKPENIMLVPDPVRTDQDRVKILDFGIAKITNRAAAVEESTTQGRTDVGMVMGTPVYMAPEQLSSEDVVDAKADVFTFGVILYELLAGRRPYKVNSLRLVFTPAEPLEKANPTTPKRLASLILRMLEVSPGKRPTMAEVEAELTALAERQDKPRRPALLLVAGGLLAVLLGGGGLLAYRHFRPLTLPESRGRALALVKENLKSGEPDDRLQATQALGKSRDIAYRPLLEPLLAEKDPAIVAAAARALADISAVESQPALLALLARTTDNKVRIEAAAALLGQSNPRGQEALTQLLAQGDDLTRLEAALRLLEHGDRSGVKLLGKVAERDITPGGATVPVLAALARVGDARARQRLTDLMASGATAKNEDPLVAFSLARLGDGAAHAQLTQLAKRTGPMQIMAARFLASLGEAEGYPLLVKASEDDRLPERLREIAVDGLGDSGQVEAAPAMARMLAEHASSKRLRLSAAGSILELAAGELGLLASRSLSWGRAALGSDSSATRELAVMLLGDLDAEDSVAALRQALKDREREVRSGAARALGRKSMRSALEALADTLDDSEAEVRSAGMQSIGQVVGALRKRGERNVESAVVGRLRQMAQGGSEVDRVVAGGTLLFMGDTSQRSVLSAGLRSDNPLARRLAVDMMEPDPAALAERLTDPDRLVQFAAARRLAAKGSRAGVEVLQSVLGDGGSDGLIAYSLLRKLGEQVEPPADLANMLTGRSLRDKESVLDVIAELPASVALRLVLLAGSDSLSIIRRRAAELANEFFARTGQAEFRNVVLGLKNDPDWVVRARAAELVARLPGSGKDSHPPSTTAPVPESTTPGGQAPTAADPGAPSSVDAATAAPGPADPSASAPTGESPGEATTKKPSTGAGAPSRSGTAIALIGDPLVRVQIDRSPGQAISTTPIPVSPGRHRVTYVGGSQDVNIASGETVTVRVPASAADQLLRDAADAVRAKENGRAQELLNRASRLGARGLKSSNLAEQYALQGKLYEGRQQWKEAMAEYMKYQKLPPGEQRGATAAEVKQAVTRLSKKLGRIQIYVLKNGQCQLSNQYYLPPGEHIISLGGGQSRTVSIDAGTTTPIRQCQ